jgi:hypothetical protein
MGTEAAKEGLQIVRAGLISGCSGILGGDPTLSSEEIAAALIGNGSAGALGASVNYA